MTIFVCMQNNDFIHRLLSEGVPFRIEILEAGPHISIPLRMDGGAIGFCTAGNAEVVIGARNYTVFKDSEIVLLDESILFIKRTSADFKMMIFIYSKEMGIQAFHKFDAVFFTYMLANPVYHHKDRNDSSIYYYLSVIYSLQKDIHNRYSVIIATNILRCIMLDIYDKIQRNSYDRSIISSRKQELLDLFMDLVIGHSRSHREVSYYADRLCISVRYLGRVTQTLLGETPKQIIDRHIISEIKLMLTFSEMTIQQIADYLHFPDQSYLGRFFKHYVGISPLAYRKQEMVM